MAGGGGGVPTFVTFAPNVLSSLPNGWVNWGWLSSEPTFTTAAKGLISAL